MSGDSLGVLSLTQKNVDRDGQWVAGGAQVVSALLFEISV